MPGRLSVSESYLDFITPLQRLLQEDGRHVLPYAQYVLKSLTATTVNDYGKSQVTCCETDRDHDPSLRP